MPFARPTTTATPDEIFEEWVHVLRHAELLALLYVVRRTLGFKKVEDSISYTQFLDGITTREGKVLDRGCGIKSRGTLAAALRRLEELRLIRSYKAQDARGDRATTRYSLWFTGDDDHDRSSPHTSVPGGAAERARERTRIEPRWYADRTTPGARIEPPLVRESNLQQTVETTNTTQQTDVSKRVPHALRSTPSLDSTDSMVITQNSISPEQSAEPDTTRVVAVVAHLSHAFGDDAPQASQTRVLNMQRAASLSDEALLALLDEATAIARSQGPTITKRGRGGTVIRMPYLLATLRSLIEATNDATDEAIVAAAPAASTRMSSPAEDAAASDLDDAPVLSAATVLWRAVLGEVRRDVTAENYAIWFAPTCALALEGDVLRVGVPTPFHAQWSEHKLRACVERALRHAGHGEVRITYEVVTPGDRVSVDVQAADQVTVSILPRAISPPRPCTSPGETPAAVSAAWPCAVSSGVPSPVVACPSCRAVPCQCRLTEQVRRVIAARRALPQTGVPGSSPSLHALC